jgi:hypothetical protein
MKFIYSVLFSFALAIPCISMAQDERDEFSEIHQRTLQRYDRDSVLVGEERFKYYTSFSEIDGDCDDFASAVYYELWKRGIPATILTYDHVAKKYRHVIVCSENYCSDVNSSDIYKRKYVDDAIAHGRINLVIEGELWTAAMYDMAIHEIIARMSTATA